MRVCWWLSMAVMGSLGTLQADEPAKVNVSHQILHRSKSVGDSRPIVKGHCKSSGKLDDEAHERNTAEAVENIDVGGNVFTRNIVGECLNF